jgi:hypothetical protein
MIAALVLAAPADAHITLTFPDGRFGNDTFQKTQPCGLGGANDKRGPNVQTFEPGETISITWDETVDHPSHFRISFDDDGQDFMTPPTETSFYVNELVEIDEIPDEPDQKYSVEYTFPLIECTNCTLQVIQVMYEGQYNPASSVYYQCSDIELAYAVEPPDTADTGDTDTDTDPPVDTDTDPVDTDTDAPPVDTDEPDDDDGEDDGGCFGSCAGVGAPVSGLGAGLALLAVVGRRRQRR